MNGRASTALAIALLALAGYAQNVTGSGPQESSTATRLPTLFIIGDSTVNNSTKGQLGWGTPVAAFFDKARIKVENRARGGRSSRTYISEGLWDQVLAEMKPGDFVLMQFGHNDGGPINDTSRARGSIRGTGDQLEEIDNLLTKKHEIVHTYGWYIRRYVADTKAKGATPIILSLVPRNIWKDGKVVRAAADYGLWAAQSAKAESALFIDLNDIVAKRYEADGLEKVQTEYFTTTDHTHTTPAGAWLNAASVVEGLKQLKGCLLATYLLSKPETVSPSNQDTRYNVLFIASDDLRPELGCYGNQIIKTPNIDRLAARGTRFERAYCQYPLCNPSRTSLLTNRYPTQTGVMDNNVYFRVKHSDYVTLPQYFKMNGYATLRAGKIFHGGIDDMVSWTEGGEPTDPAITERGTPNAPAAAPRPSTTATGAGQSRAAQSDRIVVLEGNGESHGDYKTATRAIQYLEKYKDKPFFLAVGLVKPHSPPTAPKKFFDLYDPGKMPLPPDFASSPAAPPGFPEISIAKRNADLFIGRDSLPNEAREMIRAYYASVSFMDEQVGRVIGALDRLNLRDNTIVVFWGDHGYHLGEKGKWSKAYSLYEVGTRTPLIIAVPGAKAQVSERTVQLLDMYPTLVELCGLRRPQGIEGHSLGPLLRDPRATWNHPAFTVTLYQGKLGKSVRVERWHYVEWDEGQAGAMLFDHSNDPREVKNLAEDPAYAKTVQEMKRLLKRLP